MNHFGDTYWIEKIMVSFFPTLYYIVGVVNIPVIYNNINAEVYLANFFFAIIKHIMLL